MACSVIQTARIDPILNFGSIGGHVHKFLGVDSSSTKSAGQETANGSGVDESATDESLQFSTCSSCEVQADKSIYWTPQLYFAHGNGTFEEVLNFGMTVYYAGA